nr:MAG TPA: hypothetical protein [Caudoviricetes sp.]
MLRNINYYIIPQFNVLWVTTIATLTKKNRADKFFYK